MLIQKGLTHGNTHDLEELHKRAVDGGIDIDCRDQIAAMPHWKDAVSHRYGESAPLTRSEIARIYEAALAIVVESGKRLDRNDRLTDTRMVIRRPKFAEVLRRRTER